MALTYEAISSQTLGTTAGTITLSSIPSTYTDLKLVMTASSASSADILLNVNSDTATNYSVTYFYGNGTAGFSNGGTNQTRTQITALGTSATPSFYTIDFYSYAGSTFKSYLFTSAEDKNGTGTIQNGVGMWRSTAAITSILLTCSTFAAGTTVTLYGIKAA